MYVVFDPGELALSGVLQFCWVILGWHREWSELSKPSRSTFSSISKKDIVFTLDEEGRRVVLGLGAYGTVSSLMFNVLPRVRVSQTSIES
jgi:hypothetical protein